MIPVRYILQTIMAIWYPVRLELNSQVSLVGSTRFDTMLQCQLRSNPGMFVMESRRSVIYISAQYPHFQFLPVFSSLLYKA